MTPYQNDTGSPATENSAILENPEFTNDTFVMLDIHSATPVSRVPMPSVTTMVFTPMTTTSSPLTAPTTAAARTATIAAGHTPQW